MRLRTFGGLRIDGAPQGVGGAAAQPRPLALLLLLADAGARGITRDKVAGYLWGESDRERSRSALRQTLYALRRDLQQADVVIGTTALRLNTDALSADLVDFDDAVRTRNDDAAVSLYTGPLADGFFLNGAPEFDRWIEAARQTRARQFSDAIRRLAAGARERGELWLAVEYWRTLATHDPLSADVAARLIEALADAGDRTSALRHAGLHASLVREELGVPPGDAVLALVHRLRTPPNGHQVVASEPARTASVLPGGGVDRAFRSGAGPGPTDASAAAEVGGAPASRGSGWIGQRRVRVTGLVVIVAIIVAAFFAAIGRARARPDPTLIAVAPYDASDSTLAFWRDGLMDLVAREIDRAAPLRAVTPSNEMPAASGGGEMARALGEQTNAAVVVYGELARAGHDSVDVVTSVLNRPTGEIVTVEHRASLAHLDRLIDSVAAAVVHQSVRWRPTES